MPITTREQYLRAFERRSFTGLGAGTWMGLAKNHGIDPQCIDRIADLLHGDVETLEADMQQYEAELFRRSEAREIAIFFRDLGETIVRVRNQP